jgi:hypothetical protein
MHQEGSVSMPGINDYIERHTRIRINYPEIDHGIFWIKRLSRLKHERLIKRLRKCLGAEASVRDIGPALAPVDPPGGPHSRIEHLIPM